MNTPIIHFSGISDEELEAQLTQKHEEIKKQAETLGYQLAPKRQPALKGDTLGVYIGTIESPYKELKARVLSRLNPSATEVEKKALQASTDEKIKTFEKNKQKIENDLFNYETLLQRKGISTDEIAKINSSKLFEKTPIGLYIIGISETFFTATGLQGIGHNFLISLVISLGITTALFYLAQYIGKHLKEFGKGSAKTFITAGACLLAISIFIGLALLRTRYLEEQEDTSISPFFLVSVNVLFFGVILWLSYRTTVAPETKKKEEEMLQYKNKWEELKNTLSEIDKDIKTTKEDGTQRQNLLSNKPGYANFLCERIDRMCEESINIFISSNIASRSDGVPDCFIAYSNSKQNV